MSTLKQQLGSILTQLAQQGYETRELVFDAPARLAEIERVETKLGFELPPSFREVVLTISRRVGFWWYAPDDMKYPTPFGSNFSGHLQWALDLTPEYDQHRVEFIETVFSDADDPCATVWRNKLAITPIGNGDYLAIDLLPTSYEQVVYLSHECDESNGCVLADKFADLLRRWVPMAFTGGED